MGIPQQTIGESSVEGNTPKPVGSYPPTGIEVLIVGTGLAGLSASIECIRKGHTVKVLERNANINTSGGFKFHSPALEGVVREADLCQVICTLWASAQRDSSNIGQR